METPRIASVGTRLVSSAPAGNFAGATSPIAPASVRSDDRVARIEQAVKVTDGAIAALRAQIKPGMTETEARAIIEGHFRQNGMGLSFPTISVFGQGTSDIHGEPGARKLQANDIVMLDIGARYEGPDGPWCSDVTRTFFVGEPTARQREIWTFVHDAQKLGLAQVKPGATAGQVDKAARDYLRAKGFDIPHAVGHGVGKKVHESPIIDRGNSYKLKVGDVITVEPGVYLRKEGFGVRVEDTLVVTEDGYRLLSRASYQMTQG
jgi:Xaa-Pro aminopeptidase